MKLLTLLTLALAMILVAHVTRSLADAAEAVQPPHGSVSETATFANSPFLALSPYKEFARLTHENTLIVYSGNIPRIQVGDAVLTKASVLNLIKTHAESFKNGAGLIAVVERLSRDTKDSALKAEAATIIESVKLHQELLRLDTIYLQKLADALAEERP